MSTMMVIRPLICALALALALPVSARAAEDGPPGTRIATASPPSAQTGPCERGPTGMRFGKVDLDVAACQVALMTEQLGQEAAQKAAAQAQAILSAKDKAASDAALAQREKDWRDYFAAYIAAAPAEPGAPPRP